MDETLKTVVPWALTGGSLLINLWQWHKRVRVKASVTRVWVANGQGEDDRHARYLICEVLNDGADLNDMRATLRFKSRKQPDSMSFSVVPGTEEAAKTFKTQYSLSFALENDDPRAPLRLLSPQVTDIEIVLTSGARVLDRVAVARWRNMFDRFALPDPLLPMKQRVDNTIATAI